MRADGIPMIDLPTGEFGSADAHAMVHDLEVSA